MSCSTSSCCSKSNAKSQIGLIGLAVMGQNLSLNIASKGFTISVFNRSYAKTEDTVKRAQEEGAKEGWASNLSGYKEMSDFVQSLQQPRAVIMLIQAGKPVDETIALLKGLLQKGDIIIDGGNEWYANTERRGIEATELGLHYVGMGVSGGEEGARHGPSLMPGGPRAAYDHLFPILKKISAQVADSGACVTYIGEGGAGNYVKMIHNGIEYGDMQLIAEAYDVLKNVGGLTNDEIQQTFADWNKGELQSFLIEITSIIFSKKESDGTTYVVDTILDKTGSKGTGKWTVQEAAELSIPAATISAALDARYLASLKDHRVLASKLFVGPDSSSFVKIDKKQLIADVGAALYAAKICSYAQGMNLIKKAGEVHNWKLDLGEIARIWKGGCIIRAVFLDRITRAYQKEPSLYSLFFNDEFARELQDRQPAFRKIVGLAIAQGVSVPAFSGSLAYFDSYRRDRLPANLTQAQRDFFGAHTYERVDKPGSFHFEWQK